MFLEKTALDGKVRDGGDERGVLVFRRIQPYFYDTEILFRRNCNSVNMFMMCFIGRQCFAARHVEQRFPYFGDLFIRDFIRKTPPRPIFRIFPHRRYFIAHHEKHTVFD